MSIQLPWLHPERAKALLDQLTRRILVIDGAMGTMVQSYRLDEHDYRGERFADGFDRQHEPDRDAKANPGADLKGNNDLLTLTRPDVIAAIHSAYLDAGADLVETNTFNATAVSQADYRLEHLVYELNRDGARLARAACDAAEAKTPEKPRFVIGVLGPTSRTASISPDVNDPGFRNTNFDELRATYREAAEGLVDGGADAIMVETIFDTLNAKAALYAIDELFEARGKLDGHAKKVGDLSTAQAELDTRIIAAEMRASDVIKNGEVRAARAVEEAEERAAQAIDDAQSRAAEQIENAAQRLERIVEKLKAA